MVSARVFSSAAFLPIFNRISFGLQFLGAPEMTRRMDGNASASMKSAISLFSESPHHDEID
ncbi:hypothetical protein NKI34_29465 [Mesorhizobium sp. M0700]|uniref:hypothetical protein n=1 Tax=unclassified Mesorhizobium TaxID=325217 RepID=UPI00333AC1EA